MQLALTIIDGASIKDGKIIKVERAKFELKGEYNAKLKPKKLKADYEIRHDITSDERHDIHLNEA